MRPRIASIITSIEAVGVLVALTLGMVPGRRMDHTRWRQTSPAAWSARAPRTHWETDQYGRRQLARLPHGGRVSLLGAVALLAANTVISATGLEPALAAAT